MLSCKETTRLVSEGLDHRLLLWQRIQLRMHILMCGACSVYRRQVTLINGLLRGKAGDLSIRASDPTSLPTSGVSNECRERIKDAIRSAQSSSN